MRPCVLAVVLTLLICASGRAGFEISFDKTAQLQANMPNQTIDIFLTSTFNTPVNITSMSIAAYIGTSPTVVNPTNPPSYWSPEGNFQKDVNYFGGINLTNSGYVFAGQQVGTQSFPDYGHNVTQLNVFTGGRNGVELGAGETKTLGTIQVDMTGIAAEELKIYLYDQNNWFPSGQFGTTQITTVDGMAYFAGSSDPATALIVEEYPVSSTPEPSVIGMLGLSLVTGAGWLRARTRRRNSVQ